jgi:hypothetical protein
VLLDVDVLDGAGEEFFFRWHGSYQDIKREWLGPGWGC